MECIINYFNLPFKYHLVAGSCIRLLLILYGNFHDEIYDVPYTDVDYKVFTDAARHVLNGDSPYKRHTFRYSPILAYILMPNIVFSHNFGKLMFSIFDILVTIAVKVLVEYQLANAKFKKNVTSISMYCSFFWLYNPLSIAISTRGNVDTVPCFLIILSILFLQTDVVKGLLKYVLSGALLGLSVHLRLYPIAFSFPMYLSLGEYKITRRTSLKDGLILLLPNKEQLTLAGSCAATLFMLTFGMYILYGYEFLFETYIYHLFRKDTRHNFSVLFYYSYLTMDQLDFDIVKAIALAFECIIMFLASLTFGCDKETLPFALFCQAVIMVSFNSVLTSQYFIWFLSLLPLVVHNFRVIPANALLLIIIWGTAQSGWLFYAYLLEFKSREVFILIWLKGIVFFCANMFVLGQLLKEYSPGYGFGLLNNVEEF